MTDHEKAAMEAAIAEAWCEMTPDKIGSRIWKAARAYEPPASEIERLEAENVALRKAIAELKTVAEYFLECAVMPINGVQELINTALALAQTDERKAETK